MTYRSIFHHVFWLYTGIASAVFVLIMVLLLFAMIRRRAGSGRQPSRRHENTLVELGAAVLVLGMVAYLVYVSETTYGAEMTVASRRPALTIHVTAYQWCWRFAYQGTPVAVSADCEAGRFPVLMLPTNRSVRIDLESNDVVHEMWVPHLRWKVEAFPDHVNVFDLRVDHTGTWRGLCDEFCGLFHDSMDFRVKAVTPATFHLWLQHQSAVAAAPTPTPVGGPPVKTQLGGIP